MTKITITFNISDEDYNSYNGFIDGVLNDLDDMGAKDIDVMEKEDTSKDSIQDLKEEIQNAFEDLEKKDLDALYGTLLEISENIIPNL